MFQRFRDRFGAPGIVAVCALVVALSGGAFAAVQSSDKAGDVACKAKISKNGKKATVTCPSDQLAGAAGAAGPAGPAGPQGPAGANGTNGNNGAAGTPGANGKTVLSGTGAPDNSVGTNGDFYIDSSGPDIYGPKTAGDWGLPTSLNGNNGTNGTDSPFAGGTLASGVTETGTWGATTDATGIGYGSVSFNIPLAAPITNAANIHLIGVGDPVPAECNDGTAPVPAATHPEADSGHFCLWSADGNNINQGAIAAFPASLNGDSGSGLDTVGGVIQAFDVSGPGDSPVPDSPLHGTWAVTGF